MVTAVDPSLVDSGRVEEQFRLGLEDDGLKAPAVEHERDGCAEESATDDHGTICNGLAHAFPVGIDSNGPLTTVSMLLSCRCHVAGSLAAIPARLSEFCGFVDTVDRCAIPSCAAGI